MIKTDKETVYYEVVTDRMDNDTSQSIAKEDILTCTECLNIDKAYNKDCVVLLKDSITIIATIKPLPSEAIELLYRNEAYKPNKVLISDIEKVFLIKSRQRDGAL